MESAVMRACQRLKNELGETIVETLVSILIGTLALLMLATAISTSARIVTTSKKSMEDHYEGESVVVSSPNPTTSATVSLKEKTAEPSDGKDVLTVTDVNVYMDDAGTIARYEKTS